MDENHDTHSAQLEATEGARFAQDVEAIQQISAAPAILDVLCSTTGMGFAVIARVTKDRWIACGVRDDIGFGLKPGEELSLETTICNSIRETRKVVAIDRVETDPVYADHPTPAMYGFQSYISVPIILPDGDLFGTLCAIDPKPNQVSNPATIGLFTMFSDLIAFHLDAHKRLASSAATLLDEQRTAELREQFIAVLGHDLRNPLAGISGGIDLVAKTPLNDKAKRVLPMMRKSAARMTELIDNVLDFARGRLGGGLALQMVLCNPVPALIQVVQELQSSQSERLIDTDFDVNGLVRCDPSRLSQLVSNLLANALTHGASDKPVSLRAKTIDGVFELSVSNSGEPISPTLIGRLFEPFERGAVRGQPTRAWPRSLYRFTSGQSPWRHADCDFYSGGNLLYVTDVRLMD